MSSFMLFILLLVHQSANKFIELFLNALLFGAALCWTILNACIDTHNRSSVTIKYPVKLCACA